MTNSSDNLNNALSLFKADSSLMDGMASWDNRMARHLVDRIVELACLLAAAAPAATCAHAEHGSTAGHVLRPGREGQQRHQDCQR